MGHSHAWRWRGRPWPGRAWSIRRFMLAAIALLLALLSVVDGSIAYRHAAQASDQARDRALGRIAAGYLRSLRAQDADPSKIPGAVFQEELGTRDLPWLRFRIGNDQGDPLGGDTLLPPPPPSARAEGLVQAYCYDDAAGGEALRVAAVRDYLLFRAQAQPITVQVAEPMAAREQGRREAAWGIALRQAARLAVVLALAWAVIRLGLRPLEALQRELAARPPQDLTPVAIDRPPELVPLVAALNQMLASQQESIDQQRKFLADASHQLRTPIAVLRTLVQGTLLGQSQAVDSLPKMLDIIDRATGLTNQLLSMAKTEQLVRRRDWRAVDLESVAGDVAVELAPLMARKRLDFTLQAVPIEVTTDRWMLGELVKNLLSNAIHHSQQGGALGIVVRELGSDETEMIVWDHGGGVEEEVMGRLFEPFNVAKGGTGIGLGLSICRQIAESMNASVNLFNRIEAGRVVGVDVVVRWFAHGAAAAPSAAKPPPVLHA